jgi:hypothetical protein
MFWFHYRWLWSTEPCPLLGIELSGVSTCRKEQHLLNRSIAPRAPPQRPCSVRILMTLHLAPRTSTFKRQHLNIVPHHHGGAADCRYVALDLPSWLRCSFRLSCPDRNRRKTSLSTKTTRRPSSQLRASEACQFSPEALVTTGPFLLHSRESEAFQAFADSHEHVEDSLFLISSRLLVIDESLGVKPLMDMLTASKDYSQIQ